MVIDNGDPRGHVVVIHVTSRVGWYTCFVVRCWEWLWITMVIKKIPRICYWSAEIALIEDKGTKRLTTVP